MRAFSSPPLPQVWFFYFIALLLPEVIKFLGLQHVRVAMV